MADIAFLLISTPDIAMLPCWWSSLVMSAEGKEYTTGQLTQCGFIEFYHSTKRLRPPVKLISLYIGS